GSATAGEDGVIRVMWWDGDSSKYRVKNGIIGESVDAAGNVLKPNRYYELNEEHKFISLSLDKRIEVVRGDITAQEEPFDLIVNAANESLLGGGGVDGAIHKAAGPALLDACKSLNGCLPGDAKITKGFKLRARFIAHAVGPRWVDGKAGEAEVLAAVYKRVIELATEKGLTSIAAPSISTGAFGYPLGEASGIAMRTVAALLENARIRRFRFVCFDAKTERAYDAAKRTVLGL
ncbi:MAG TPA: macro domain-containing protein, partial [Thauera aminoaromatica]|nr:macro domain-containing protein [Thauera aminoaromatica]